MKITVYDNADSANTYQILTFAVISCGLSNNQVIIDPLGQYCLGDSVFVSANNGFFNYIWSNGGTSQTEYFLVDNEITIIADDNLGCINRDTLNLNVSVPYNEEICIISVDSATGKNIIVWEKTSLVKTAQTYIYKESFVAGTYNLIGFVPFGSLSVFIDNASIPQQNADSYKISVIDSCGNESNRSTKHKTIHLTASVGVGGENNLVWDGYEGFSFNTYNILRGPNPGNMSILNSVANTLFTYSDLTPPAGTNYYQIEAVKNSSCTPTQKTYLSSVSNSIILYPLAVGDIDMSQAVTIYPNPTTGRVTVNLAAVYNDVTVNVINVVGSIVLSKTFESSDKINVEINNKPGFYFIEIVLDNNIVITKKLLVKE
ncbi:MAG: T9SS type A sorting domain-containing protein [Flavobacteriales bacterium]|nr:T9SS type A sorting domain-containing protein [Flavobacteriales bacterium]